jgi:hypothetical protein
MPSGQRRPSWKTRNADHGGSTVPARGTGARPRRRRGRDGCGRADAPERHGPGRPAEGPTVRSEVRSTWRGSSIFSNTAAAGPPGSAYRRPPEPPRLRVGSSSDQARGRSIRRVHRRGGRAPRAVEPRARAERRADKGDGRKHGAPPDVARSDRSVLGNSPSLEVFQGTSRTYACEARRTKGSKGEEGVGTAVMPKPRHTRNAGRFASPHVTTLGDLRPPPSMSPGGGRRASTGTADLALTRGPMLGAEQCVRPPVAARRWRELRLGPGAPFPLPGSAPAQPSAPLGAPVGTRSVWDSASQ